MEACRGRERPDRLCGSGFPHDTTATPEATSCHLADEQPGVVQVASSGVACQPPSERRGSRNAPASRAPRQEQGKGQGFHSRIPPRGRVGLTNRAESPTRKGGVFCCPRRGRRNLQVKVEGSRVVARRRGRREGRGLPETGAAELKSFIEIKS